MQQLRVLSLLLVMMGALAPAAKAQAALLVLVFGDKVASENFFFSLKGGLNYTGVSGVTDASYKRGWNFGLLATIKVNDRFYIVPEFAPLSQKGAKNVPYVPSDNQALDALITPPDEARLNFNYIDVPVIAKFFVTERLAVGTGPQFGYQTSAHFDYDRALNDEDRLRYTQESQVDWNRFDVGWAAEVTFGLGNARAGKGINLHARYTIGLMDTIKDNPSDAVRNSAFQFFVSLPFINVEDDDEP